MLTRFRGIKRPRSNKDDSGIQREESSDDSDSNISDSNDASSNSSSILSEYDSDIDSNV